MGGLELVIGSFIGIGTLRLAAAFIGDLMAGDAELGARDTTKMKRTGHLNLVG